MSYDLIDYTFLYADMSSINWDKVLRPKNITYGQHTIADKLDDNGEFVTTIYNEYGKPLESRTTYQSSTDVVVDTWEYNDEECVHTHTNQGTGESWVEHDPNNNTSIKYDDDGKIIEDYIQTYEYDENDRLIKIDSKIRNNYIQTYECDENDRLIKIDSKLCDICWKCNWSGDLLDRIDTCIYTNGESRLLYSIYIKYDIRNLRKAIKSVQYYRKDDNGMGILNWWIDVEYNHAGNVQTIKTSDDDTSSCTTFLYNSTESLLMGEIHDGDFNSRSITTYRYVDIDES